MHYENKADTSDRYACGRTCGLHCRNGGTYGRFVKMLLVVLIVFYIIGGIVKLLIDKNFKDMEEETTDGEETPAEAEEKEEPEQESDEQDEK